MHKKLKTLIFCHLSYKKFIEDYRVNIRVLKQKETINTVSFEFKNY